jgi:hypothetical protein
MGRGGQGGNWAGQNWSQEESGMPGTMTGGQQTWAQGGL